MAAVESESRLLLQNVGRPSVLFKLFLLLRSKAQDPTSSSCAPTTSEGESEVGRGAGGGGAGGGAANKKTLADIKWCIFAEFSPSER